MQLALPCLPHALRNQEEHHAASGTTDRALQPGHAWGEVGVTSWLPHHHILMPEVSLGHREIQTTVST